MPKLSGNKGEWSEIYVLLRLLELGRLYAADADLRKIDDVFYNIINIIRSEKTGILEFRINSATSRIAVYNTSTDSVLAEISIKEFKSAADELLSEIRKADSAAFTVDDVEAFLSRIKVESLKAKSTDKSDIRIKIHDINTGFEAVQGFSIKSRLGGASTLINAGKTTNFIFEITGPVDDTVMSRFNSLKRFQDKFCYLEKKANCGLVYSGMNNETFENNLVLIDGDLPRICAYMLYEYYSSGVSTIDKSLESIIKKNPMGYRLINGQPFYRYKFKKLLTESALGMLPSKPWDGFADATGGYIIVREDGEVLCYHLFNRNEFEEYLINNTRFETASTSRHDFGFIYKEYGKYYLKLNLQIRFKG